MTVSVGRPLTAVTSCGSVLECALTSFRFFSLLFDPPFDRNFLADARLRDEYAPSGPRSLAPSVRSAVAVGGAGALAPCTSREEDVPQADLDPEELPDRQHAWNEFLDRDDHGNVRPPEHHLLLGLEYVGGGLDGSGDLDNAERERLEDAFTTLERAYGRGNDGLAFTVGYGPTYFDRFDGDLPEGVDLPEPEPLAPIEDPDLDAYDALLHLASDHGQVVLSAEEALTGALEEINDVSVEGSLEGVLEVTDRRTGFVGEGLPAENQAETRGIPDSEPVPDDAPFFMGFKSGFDRNQASENRVTISEGPFEGGTTTHLSKIDLNLQQWYEQDSRDQRVAKLFCPAHADEDRVEGAGHNLGDSSGVEGCIEDAETDARNGLVGHAQKAGCAREDGDPIILRRDFNSTDDDQAGLQFLSHQRSIDDFVATREAMTGGDLTDGSIDSRLNNGILQYVRVRRRANYLVPPRRHRALPTPVPG